MPAPNAWGNESSPPQTPESKKCSRKWGKTNDHSSEAFGFSAPAEPLVVLPTVSSESEASTCNGAGQAHEGFSSLVEDLGRQICKRIDELEEAVRQCFQDHVVQPMAQGRESKASEMDLVDRPLSSSTATEPAQSVSRDSNRAALEKSQENDSRPRSSLRAIQPSVRYSDSPSVLEKILEDDSRDTIPVLSESVQLLGGQKPFSEDSRRDSIPVLSESVQLLGGQKPFSDDSRRNSTVSHDVAHADLNSGVIPSEMWPCWMKCELEVRDDGVTHRDTDLEVDFRHEDMMARGISIGNWKSKCSVHSSEGEEAACSFTLPSCLIMHPASRAVMLWCVLGVVLLTYDMLAIPLQAFPFEERQEMEYIVICATVYWTSDIFRNFITGYECPDFVELRSSQIAKRYLRTWFALDFSSCVLDWLTLFLAGSKVGKFWRAGRAMTALKIVQPARFVRIVRLYRSLNDLLSRNLSVKAWIATRSISLIITIVFACHSMACYWYFVGHRPRSPTWLHEHGLQDDTDVGKLYTMCFHWSMAQSGLLTSQIYPTNENERLFACFVALIWLILIGVSFNSFNLWATQIRAMNADRENQSKLIARYLEDHKTSKATTYDVLRCFRTSYAEKRPRVHKQEVAFLTTLPLHLQITLHTEVYVPQLKTHTFFRFLDTVNNSILSLISYLALRESHVWPGHTIFSEGTTGSHMLQVQSGEMEYFAPHHVSRFTFLKAGDWACEPALWLRWTTQGRLMASSSGELMFVTVETFRAIIKDAKLNGTNVQAIQNYAKRVCEHFLETCPKSDLWGPQAIMETLAEASRPTRCSTTQVTPKRLNMIRSASNQILSQYF